MNSPAKTYKVIAVHDDGHEHVVDIGLSYDAAMAAAEDAESRSSSITCRIVEE